jgi:hypothetical protein
MGVDYSPVLIVGWPIEWKDVKKIAGLGEDADSYEIREAAESSTRFPVKETGWRGDAEYYVSLLGGEDDPSRGRTGPRTIDDIEALKPLIEECRQEFAALGVELKGSPMVAAELYVW